MSHPFTPLVARYLARYARHHGLAGQTVLAVTEHMAARPGDAHGMVEIGGGGAVRRDWVLEVVRSCGPGVHGVTVGADQPPGDHPYLRRTVSVERLVELAGGLAEEFGTDVNPEYDRALVELIVDAAGLPMGGGRDEVAALVKAAADRHHRRVV